MPADLVVGLVDARGVEIGPDLAEDVLVARFLKVGYDHRLGVILGRLAFMAEQLRRPLAEHLVAPGLRLEPQSRVVGEFALKLVFAVVKAAHAHTPCGEKRGAPAETGARALFIAASPRPQRGFAAAGRNRGAQRGEGFPWPPFRPIDPAFLPGTGIC